MSRDEWSRNVRQARRDPGRLIEVLRDLPTEALQVAGSALLPHLKAPGGARVADRLITLLGDRGWEGDPELIAELEGRAELRPLAVDLEVLAESLDESEASEGFLDLQTGQVWPAMVFEDDQGPEDADLDDETRWLLVRGLGPSESRRDMRDFSITVDNPQLRLRLMDAHEGRGGHRRFRDLLSRYDEEFTRWHVFRDDRWIGRARAWLADAGYRSTFV